VLPIGVVVGELVTYDDGVVDTAADGEYVGATDGRGESVPVGVPVPLPVPLPVQLPVAEVELDTLG
jgi:hypothetical protein